MTDGALPVVVLEDRDPEEEVVDVLREAQRLVFKYPVASQAIVQAFVAEGRRFARTDEGRRWRERLAASDLLQRGRAVWDVGSLGAFREQPEGALPTVMVDAVVQAAANGDIESLLSIFAGGRENE